MNSHAIKGRASSFYKSIRSKGIRSRTISHAPRKFRGDFSAGNYHTGNYHQRWVKLASALYGQKYESKLLQVAGMERFDFEARAAASDRNYNAGSNPTGWDALTEMQDDTSTHPSRSQASQASKNRSEKRELRFLTTLPDDRLFCEACDELKAALHLNRSNPPSGNDAHDEMPVLDVAPLLKAA